MQLAETENEYSHTSSSATVSPVPDDPEVCTVQSPDGYPGNPNYNGGNSTPVVVGNTTEYLWVLPTSCLTGTLPNGDCGEPVVQSRFNSCTDPPSLFTCTEHVTFEGLGTDPTARDA